MSDEKKREELKAKINEGLDELSLDELEKVAGGMNILEDFVKERNEEWRKTIATLKSPCPTCKADSSFKEIDGKWYLYCENCNQNYPTPF